jgi:hypothetical protein
LEANLKESYMKKAVFLLLAALCLMTGHAQQTGGDGVPGGTVNATSLQGTPVSPTTPTSNQMLQDIGGALTGIRQANGSSADSAATSSQMQAAIGSGLIALLAHLIGVH